MIKTCQICNKEFETNYPNKKYCDIECSREQRRQHDRMRKLKERKIERDKKNTEYIEIRKIKMNEMDKITKEKQREKKSDLESRLLQGDYKAIMEVSNHFDIEYWEAFKNDFIQNDYTKDYILYVNEFNIYDKNFTTRVIDSIRINGRIYSKLIKNKK